MNTLTQTISPPTYPAYPVNGGPLDRAPEKHGEWYYEPKYNGWRVLVHAPTGQMFNHQLQRSTIEHEFTAAIEKLRSLKLNVSEWFDCEALARRHNIGRGTLILLDFIPTTMGVGVVEERRWTAAGTYLARRALLELSARFADVPTHTELNKPIEPHSLYLVPSYKAAGALARVGDVAPEESGGSRYENMRGLWDLLKECKRGTGLRILRGPRGQARELHLPRATARPEGKVPLLDETQVGILRKEYETVQRNT